MLNMFRWTAFVLMAVALAACGVPGLTAQPVARVGDVSLTQQELDARIKRVQDAMVKEQAATPNAPPPPSVDEIKRGVVNLFIEQNLVLDLAKQRDVTIGDEAVNGEIERIRTQVEQPGGQGQPEQKLDDIVQGRLGLPGAESTEFRQFVSYLLAQEKLGATLVTTDSVRAEIEPMIKAEAAKTVKEFHSAHILFLAGTPQQGGPPPTDAEFAAALEKANKAEERLANGEDFATLAKELSEDPGSKDKGGEYDWMKQGSFVPEYEKAVFEDLKPGEYTKTPVKSQFGYHIIKLLDPIRESPSIPPEQVSQVIDQQLDQQVPQRQQAAVQDLITKEREKFKEEGRLVEPDFMNATAVPAEQPPAEQPPAEQPAPTVQP